MDVGDCPDAPAGLSWSRMRILYKILPEAEWRKAVGAGRFEGSAVDHRDGFIHLSAAHQLPGTAEKHFAGQSGLLLVGFPEDDLTQLRWEPSRGGDLFPHVYGAIPTRLVCRVQALELDRGMLRLPGDIT